MLVSTQFGSDLPELFVYLAAVFVEQERKELCDERAKPDPSLHIQMQVRPVVFPVRVDPHMLFCHRIQDRCDLCDLTASVRITKAENTVQFPVLRKDVPEDVQKPVHDLFHRPPSAGSRQDAPVSVRFDERVVCAVDDLLDLIRS